ncbi:glycosyl hydrolase family [Zalerion maritima]|uniref:Glycosyl hydrolase family n=1 Tax=Zalerion maritima TaxID=339359 RepID=A0AAD5WY00_9PEZI|nr:glycosyl hydrolase family [Zalerion maritima]
MPLKAHGIPSSNVHSAISLLINGLVNIKDTSGEFLMTLPDGRVIDTKGWNDWEWTHGVGLYGLWQHHVLTGSSSSLEVIEEWFRNRFAEGGTTKNINTMAAMLTLCCLYEHEKQHGGDSAKEATKYLAHLEAWADWAMNDLIRTRQHGLQHVTYLDDNHQQLWADTLVMTCLPLAKIGLVLNKPQYIAEAKRQFLLHSQYLFDAPTGLFFHGWQFYDESNPAPTDQPHLQGHNFARARWARGNSWATIAIPELISLLNLDPEHDPLAVHLVSVLRAQIEALLPLQAKNGLWCTLLDVPESEGSYPEASATAGFAAGMLKACRLRLFPKKDCERYTESAVKAAKAVLDNVSVDGELLSTSFGTGMGSDYQHYKNIPITPMPYGQAMALLALGEFLRLYI